MVDPKEKSIPVDIFAVDEPWAYARLANGDMIKAKVVFMKIARALDDDGKPKFNEDGTPLYAIGTQLLLHSLSKEEVSQLDVKVLQN